MNGNGKEMMQIYSDIPVLVELIKLREDSRLISAMKDQIIMLEQGLRFLVIYREILTLCDPDGVCPEGMFLCFFKMAPVVATLQKKGLLESGVLALDTGEFRDWDTLASRLLAKINSYKEPIREQYPLFSSIPYYVNLCATDSLLKFMKYTHVSMTDVLKLKGDMIPYEKMKFESLKDKLDMLRIVFDYVKESDSNYWDFRCAVLAWVRSAAYLCLLYWVLDEYMATERKGMLPKLYRKLEFPHHQVTKYCLDYLKILVEEQCKVREVVFSDVTRMCLSYLNATKPSADKRHEAIVIAFTFVESLHSNLRVYLPNDAIEMLCDAMLFLIAFVMDPPFADENEGQSILTQTQEALKVVATLVNSLGSCKNDEAGITEAANFLLHDLFEIVVTIKAEVRQTCSHLFLDPSFGLPWINVLNLFASSIENLKEFHSRFSNHPFFTIEKGLIVLREILEASNWKSNFFLELKNEHIDLKNLWTRISNVAYQADRIIRSCTYQNGLGIDIVILLDVKQEIKRLLPKVKRIKFDHVLDSFTYRTELNSNPIVPLKFDVQDIDEVVVGFEDKAKEIRDWLTYGSEKLDLISIIGMAGLGKTTLAKKVYNDPFVKGHFTTRGWCTVSQSYDSKKLLLDILKVVTKINDKFIEMEEEDLSHKLWKCLKGKRYLIVMDDIWDVGAWNALKLSFPDDENYSRILFTSRIHNVVLDAKSDSFPYPLGQLSNEESWELLERRLFNDKDTCPREFVQYGKQITVHCKGLPLAVVLVAGLLKNEIDNLGWWKQIGKSLNSRISKEGCAHILELSYKHLSEPLKACFLYLGLFEEDKVIQVQKLINLWVSEGFIPNKDMKDVEIVAKQYVMDLISKSLLIVCNKSSSGGIKSCRIHDLLREFCLEKSEKERFFKLFHEKNVSYHTMDEHYRVSIQTQHWKILLVRKLSPLYSVRTSSMFSSNAFDISPNFFCNARFLHVLDLEEAKFVGDFPEEITALIFLRYLAIWCTTKFIPATVVRLGKLETLRIIRKDTFILPAAILRMESLRHVHIGKFFPYVLFGTILPMKNLLSFSSPCLTYGKGTEAFLSKLRTIQKLKCQFNSYQQDQMVKLDFLNQLESLNMIHDGCPRPHKFVFFLPTNIKKLTMSNFGLPWSEISRIAELPHLEILKLLVDAFMGKFWNIEAEEEFKKLKFLKLKGLNVQKWSASHKNFPSLEQIVVEQCHKLEEIPIEFVTISTLRTIQIRRCRSSVVNSAKEIEDEQIEIGNLNFKVQAVQILPEKLFG